jgi:A/G-specific adenine glycosylase
MLQQTQVATVLPYYIEWLRRFPNFATLAAAPESDVLHAWQGLGYYARARNLHAAAKVIASGKAGAFPTSVSDIRELPGLGRYSANAIATFAFDQSVPLVEANIGRLFARLSNLQLSIDSTAGREAVWNLATQLLPRKKAGAYNSALMDFGALVCVSGQPKCSLCPVRRFCRAEEPARLPVKRPRPTLKRMTEHHRFALKSGRVLLEQSRSRWRGMWILPRLDPRSEIGTPLHSIEFPFTHHRVTLAVFSAGKFLAASPAHRWFACDELPSLPLPSPHRRALEYLLTTNSLQHIRADLNSTTPMQPRRFNQ